MKNFILFFWVAIISSLFTNDYKFMPLIDGSLYSSSGIGLVNNEFFSWVNKNTLDYLTRGQNGTTAITQDINTGVNIVSRFGGQTLNRGAYWVMPKGDYITSITLTSGSVIAYGI
jgi:hypothetical protein